MLRFAVNKEYVTDNIFLTSNDSIILSNVTNFQASQLKLFY